MNNKQIAGIAVAALGGGFLGWYITFNYLKQRWYEPATPDEVSLLANTPYRGSLALTVRPRGYTGMGA